MSSYSELLKKAESYAAKRDKEDAEARKVTQTRIANKERLASLIQQPKATSSGTKAASGGMGTNSRMKMNPSGGFAATSPFRGGSGVDTSVLQKAKAAKVSRSNGSSIATPFGTAQGTISKTKTDLSAKPDTSVLQQAQSRYGQWNQEYETNMSRYLDDVDKVSTAAGMGYSDADAEAALKKSTAAKEATQNAWADTMQGILDSLGDGAKAQFNQWANTEDKAKKSERWTRLYNTYGKDLANQLGEYVTQQKNKANMEETVAATKEYANEHGVKASLASVPQNLAGGITGTLNTLAQGADRLFTGSHAPIDWNTEEQEPGRKATTTRSTVSENLNEKYGSSVPGFLYQTGMSMLDSAATMPLSAVSGGAGTVLLGMSAANSSMQEAKANGATDDQAISLGLITGAVEVLTEKVSIDSLFELKDVKSAKDMVGNIIKQAIPEASEEAISEIADTVAETIILGDKSEFRQQMAAYQQQGLNRDQAFAKAVGNVAVNVGVSALGGGLSGAVFATAKGLGGYGIGKIRGGTESNVSENPTGTLMERATQNVQPVNTTTEQSNLLDTSIQNTLAELGVGQQAQQTQPAAQNTENVREAALPVENNVDAKAGTVDEQGRAWGKADVTYTQGNDAVNVRYAVVPAESLIVSNDYDGTTNPNYPAELQPRDRTRTSSQLQVQQMARNLNPGLLASSATAQNGSPIIRSDGVVVSGNGRSAAVNLAYQKGWADNYRNYVVQHAAEYGIDANSIPEHPVLVRVAEDTDTNWAALSRKLNESTLQSYSTTEQAMSDAKGLDKILDNLQFDEKTGDITNQNGSAFIQDFLQSVVPREEWNNMTDSNNNLSQAGQERIKQAVFAYAYGDASLSARLSESLDNDAKNITTALMRTAARAAQLKNNIQNGTSYDLDMVDDVKAAVDLFLQLKTEGRTLEQWQSQTNMLDSYSPETQCIAGFMQANKRGAKQLTDFLNAVYAEVEALGDPGQQGLFGGNEDVSKSDIIQRAADRYTSGNPNGKLGFDPSDPTGTRNLYQQATFDASPGNDPANAAAGQADNQDGSNLQGNAEGDQQPGGTASAIEADVNPSIGAADKGFTGEIGKWKGEARDFIKESQIPTTDKDGNKISASAGSMTETDVPFATKEAVERGAYEGKYSYTPDTNKSQVSRVHQRLESEGFDSLYNQTVAEIQSGKSSADLSAQAYILFIQAANEGRDAQAAELASCIQLNSTNTAQALQAMSIYNRLSPEGRLIAKQKIVNQMNQKQVRKSRGLREWSDVGELDSVSGETATETTTDAQTGEKTKRKRKAKVKDSVKTAVEDAIDATANDLNNLGSENARDEGLEKIAKALAKAVDRKVADQDAARNFQDAEGAILERQELSETDSAAEEKAAMKRELANIRKDVWKMAKDYLLPKEKGTPRTAVDTLRDFFQNREEYNTVWNKAKEHVRNAHIGEPETPAFSEATMTYNGTGSDPVMTKAIVDEAIKQEIKGQDVRSAKWLGDESTFVTKVANSLIEQTGATGEDATLIEDACARYFNEMVLQGKDNPENRARRAIKSALSEQGMKLKDVLNNKTNRSEVVKEVAQEVAKSYSDDPGTQKVTAQQLENLLNTMLSEVENSDKPVSTFEQKLLKVGDELARAVEPETFGENQKAPKKLSAEDQRVKEIKQDVWRMAKDYLPKKKSSGKTRTAIDTLKGYFEDPNSYSKAWNRATEDIRNAHIGEMDFPEFAGATMGYNGVGTDPVMTKAIMDDAIAQEIKSSDIQLNSWLGNESALVDKLAESLIRQTGATEGNAEVIRAACTRYVNEQALNGNVENTTKRVQKGTRELLDAAGTSLSELMKQHPGSREETIGEISRVLADIYGVEPENMQKASGKIADLIDGMIQERAQKNVENVLESEQKKMSNSMKKTLKQTLREAANQGLFSNQDAADIVTRKLFGQPIQIDGDLLQRYLNARTDEEIDAVETEVYKNIASQLPASFAEKANTWRYMAMLTNPRTHVRNMAGNAAFVGIRKTKNVIGTALESLFTDRSQRTKSIGAGKDLRNAAKADYDNVEQLVLYNGKYDDARSKIQENRQIFGNKTLEAIRDWNSGLLDKEDSIFAKGAYADSLAGFLKARGISAEDFTSGRCGQAVKDEARAYAIKEAQKATYRDLNSFSEFVQGIGFKNAEGNKYKTAANSVIEGILPFRKTPADILARGVEYSPVGILTTLAKGAVDLKSGKITAAQYIDRISAKLTGTGIFALGYLLSKLGIAVATPDDEDQSDLEGHQNYSIELFGNKYSVTADWLAPTCMPFYMGVQTFDVFNRETGGAPAMEKVQTALRGIADPLLEMSMMSGLQDAMEATEYAENDLAAFASNAALGYLKQYIPTVFGSLKRTFEQDVRTTTFTTDSDPVLSKDAQYSIGSVASKIPFANYNQVPYIDAWGRTEDQGNLAERAFNNLINPAYTSDVVETDVDKEIKRLEKATGENYTPTRGSNQLTIKGNTVFLTKDEYVTYATAKGQNDLEFRTNLIGNDSYDLLSDTDKGAAMDYAEKYANIRAEQEVGLKPEVPNWAKKLEDASVDEITEAILAQVVSNKAGNADNKYASLSEQLDSGIPEETILQALTEDQQEKYEANCRKAKVSAGEYLDVLSFYKSAESDKDKDGKTVSGSKKAKVVEYISGLNLSRKQKRALYLCFYKGDDFE